MSQGRKTAPAPSLFFYVDEEQLYGHIPTLHFCPALKTAAGHLTRHRA